MISEQSKNKMCVRLAVRVGEDFQHRTRLVVGLAQFEDRLRNTEGAQGQHNRLCASTLQAGGGRLGQADHLEGGARTFFLRSRGPLHRNRGP